MGGPPGTKHHLDAPHHFFFFFSGAHSDRIGLRSLPARPGQPLSLGPDRQAGRNKQDRRVRSAPIAHRSRRWRIPFLQLPCPDTPAGLPGTTSSVLCDLSEGLLVSVVSCSVLRSAIITYY